MIDPQQLQDAKHALGRKLAELRKARRLLQKDVAERVHSTRSTVANVEAGRQVVDRVFWRQCDALLKAGGTLSAGYDAYRRLEEQYQTCCWTWLTRVRDWPATPTTPAAAACGKRRERRSC